jgi:hypothetical protein
MRPWFGRTLAPLELVDLGGKYEIAFAETVDLVRPRGDFSFAPGEQDIRVVPLLFGKLSDFIHENQRLAKIRKRKRASDVVPVHNLPLRHFCSQRLKFLAG